ncbi:MAG: T9SS type A sorting domain-containing protein [Nonlabens sp.]|nr:T9SS type A sorting domain-containing protein [Nonlabens sp.]
MNTLLKEYLKYGTVFFMVFAFAKANKVQAQSIHDSHSSQESIIACQSKARVLQNSIAKGATTTSGNYDMKYARLELNVDPSVASISGTVTSHFTAVTDLNQIIMDLASNINVSAVTQRGFPLSYTHNASDELVISFPTTQLAGVLDSISVSYSGNPIASGFGSFAQTTHAGAPIIWTLSEPYGAKAWWPCKQDLNDKIDRVEVAITSPAGNTAISNGLLLSETTVAQGKRFFWRHDYPIPAYLVAIAVTNYAKYTDVVGAGATALNIDNYVYPENLASAQAQTAVTVPIMQFFENTFGAYPFRNEKYGHAQFGWGGGMEHTTISFMGNFSRGLIAHELAHQWFGNKVTCGSWQDIWLNESFATYLTGMTVEHLDGQAAFKNWRESVTSNATSNTSGSVYVPAQDTLSVGRVFSGRLSYNKGAMVLHMLRRKLGDAVFTSSLQNYLNDPAFSYDYAKTADFQNFMELQTGVPLAEFFNDWIYGEGNPSYDVRYQQLNPTTLRIQVFQQQSHPSVSFFEGDLPLRFTNVSGQVQDVIVPVDFDGHITDITVPFVVSQVTVDPDTHVLSTNNSSTLSVESAFAKANFTIYPNPATTRFTIQTQLQVERVTIYDLQGRLMQQFTATASDLTFPAPQKAGLYLLTVETENGVYNERLLVK